MRLVTGAGSLGSPRFSAPRQGSPPRRLPERADGVTMSARPTPHLILSVELLDVLRTGDLCHDRDGAKVRICGDRTGDRTRSHFDAFTERLDRLIKRFRLAAWARNTPSGVRSSLQIDLFSPGTAPGTAPGRVSPHVQQVGVVDLGLVEDDVRVCVDSR
jgi:hypothetical protein